MFKTTLFIIAFCVSVGVQAQFTGHYNALNVTGSQFSYKTPIPLTEPVVTGSTYASEDWQQAELVLKDGTSIPDLSIRIEIEHANIEIQYNGQIKFLKLEAVDSLRLTHSGHKPAPVIRKAAEYQVDGVPLKGIAVVYDGLRYDLVRNYYIEFRASNYNVAMDVGSREHQKIKKEKLYLYHSGRLIPVKGSNKKMIKRLGKDAAAAAAIVREKNLNLSREEDLLTLVETL